MTTRTLCRHYWIKSNITEDRNAWEVGFLDAKGNWWIFGIQGWFPESELDEIGPEIISPAKEEKA